MLQFYLLSVSLNLIGGLILIFSQNQEFDTEEVGVNGAKSDLFFNQKFRLIIGVSTFAIGFLKFISPIKGSVALFGDVIPAIAGLCAGFSLLLEYYLRASSMSLKIPSKITEVFLDNKKYLGFFCLVVALLHFLFPGVLFI
ncbi:MAG: hypothetical protein ACRC4W_08985 [Treponemataceae bacterium]